MLTCGKNFNHSGSPAAVELLLVVSRDGGITAMPRCPEHPAADDVPLIDRMGFGDQAHVVPLPPGLTGR